MSIRLKSIDAHHAFFLHRNCLSIPRPLFKPRSSPCFRLHSELTQFDMTLRHAASTVCNVKFDDTGWQQTTLPVAQGGLGQSSTVNVSLLAYASSINATRQIVGQILQDVFESCPTSEVDSVTEHWTALGHEPITTDKMQFQLHWPSATYEAIRRSAKSSITTAKQSHSGD